MKMVLIVYNEVMDTEVMAVLAGCAVKNYTKASNIHGKGTSSGTHLGNDVWPGANMMLYVACPDEDAARILSCVRALRQSYAHEGIKAFMLPVEEMT
jgi:nitrogen regulatory protein PII